MTEINNVKIEVIKETPHGTLGKDERGDLVFRQYIVHSGVEKFYSKWGAAHSLIHAAKMLSTPRLWKESLTTVGVFGAAVILGGPAILAVLGGLLFNGVQAKVGIPGLNAVSKGGIPPMLEVNYWNR